MIIACSLNLLPEPAFPVCGGRPPWSDFGGSTFQLRVIPRAASDRTLRGPIRSPRGGGSYSSPTRGIPSVGGPSVVRSGSLRRPVFIPSVGGPSVVRSDRRAEAAPTLRRPVAFPVWEDPPWSDQVHFADPRHSQCRRPSVVRSDRRAEAAPTLCRPVAFPVWEDPPWSDQVHFADPWHSQ